MRFLVAILALATLAACVARTPPPAPLPPPVPPQPVAPPAPPAPAPAPAAWEDGPLAPGDWTYVGAGPAAEARFGTPDAIFFALRCEAGGRIAILRPGADAGAVTILTSFGERIVPASADAAGAAAALPASDLLFDQMAFSRGRFLVRAAGAEDLVLPSWPEPARLIEDCRG